jgi:hypothetical protein
MFIFYRYQPEMELVLPAWLEFPYRNFFTRVNSVWQRRGGILQFEMQHGGTPGFLLD